MKALGILKLDDLYKQQCSTLVYDCVKNTAPQQICSLVQLKVEKNDYSLRTNTENSLDLREITLKTKQGKRSFRAQAPVLWNALGGNVREIDGRNIFKKTLKKCILSSYTNDIDCNNPLCRDHKYHNK
jgi:hypothetical protein